MPATLGRNVINPAGNRTAPLYPATSRRSPQLTPSRVLADAGEEGPGGVRVRVRGGAGGVGVEGAGLAAGNGVGGGQQVMH